MFQYNVTFLGRDMNILETKMFTAENLNDLLNFLAAYVDPDDPATTLTMEIIGELPAFDQAA